MRRLHRFHPSAVTLAVSAVFLLSVSAGCRNTTNAPISPLGSASPLTPVSPMQPQLSPVQPTSGFSTFGGPTRVPPPPTGADQASSGFAAPGFNSNGYAPAGVNSTPAPNAVGFNAGTTQSLPAPTTSDPGVRQTTWIGAGNTAPAANQASLGGDPTGMPAPNGPRTGGMQVIDLTTAPYPPGYAPPPTPQAYPSGMTYVQSPQTTTPNVSVGQPVNSTFAPQAGPSALPSTEPYPAAQSASSDELQWRRPSPRF